MSKIITYPNKLLSMKSEPVSNISSSEVSELQVMHSALEEKGGIGIAAPQIGILKRMIIVQIDSKEPIFMINPKIVTRSPAKIKFNEGCLSLPGVYADVVRSNEIEFQYLDMSGKPVFTTGEGIFAVCVQHEIDHLDGKLFIDRLSKKGRSDAIKAYYAKGEE